MHDVAYEDARSDRAEFDAGAGDVPVRFVPLELSEHVEHSTTKTLRFFFLALKSYSLLFLHLIFKKSGILGFRSLQFMSFVMMGLMPRPFSLSSYEYFAHSRLLAAENRRLSARLLRHQIWLLQTENTEAPVDGEFKFVPILTILT